MIASVKIHTAVSENVRNTMNVHKYRATLFLYDWWASAHGSTPEEALKNFSIQYRDKLCDQQLSYRPIDMMVFCTGWYIPVGIIMKK